MSRFSLARFYEYEDGWAVLRTRGDCGSCAWLMTNALGVLGIGSEVRYVHPVTGSWDGLWSYQPERRNLGYMGQSGLIQTFYYYEGCCYVTDGASIRYYLGGFNGQYRDSAYSVLMRISGPNLVSFLPHQCYSSDTSQIVRYPSGRPPAEYPSLRDTALLQVVAESSSQYPTGPKAAWLF